MNTPELQVIRYEQPFEISTKIGIEVDSKGQKKPSVEIKISQKVDNKVNIPGLLECQLRTALDKAKAAMEELK